jgi:hypothetical protein
MSKKKTTVTFLILAVLPSLLALVACNPIEDQSKSSTFIVVETLTGTDIAGKTVATLQSDVLTSDGTIVADFASATIRASLLDPAPALKPSGYSDIILDRYVVSYSRADGRNRQGIDVPYTFEGAMTQVVKVGTTATFSFVIVREVAKAEPPLSDLAKGFGDGVIYTTARVDFYGHDLLDNTVMATGYLAISFTNYSD